LAGSGYKFYRNVKDYGADSTGAKDAVEAINAAIADGNRCAGECGNTFTKGAIIYFPVLKIHQHYGSPDEESLLTCFAVWHV
jgi:hypothetical protein